MATTVHFRLYAELNRYLPERDGIPFALTIFGNCPTVGEAISATGVPLEAIELVAVNGESVGLDRPLEEGDLISLYPMFESFNVTSDLKLHSAPQRKIAFVLDIHLGKLCKYLRMVGLDAVIARDIDDLLKVAKKERRILLTRSGALVSGVKLTHALRVQSPHPRAQLLEVLTRLDLFEQLKPFSRCLICNNVLAAVKREDCGDQPGVAMSVESIDPKQCPNCRRVYWAGSHHRRMRAFLDRLVSQRLPGD